jgi:hypothetical protein
MTIINIVFEVAFLAMVIYMARVIAKRERVLREPVKYMVSYLRMDGSRSSYGSIGIDVRGGIKGKNFQEVVEIVRKQSGFPDAFVMGFSRYED